LYIAIHRRLHRDGRHLRRRATSRNKGDRRALTKSRMILHAERGANIHQIAAWSGHETLKEIERYTRAAEKRRLLSPEPSVLETGLFLEA